VASALEVAHYESGWEYSNSWQSFCLVIIMILKSFYGALIITTYNCVLRHPLLIEVTEYKEALAFRSMVKR
jgi:hypothetical protein